jgi:hypothetical protein
MTNVIPTPQGSRDVVAPTSAHPIWCDELHNPSTRVHAAYFGTVGAGERHSFDIEAADYGDGTGPRVVLIEWTGEDQTVTHLTAAQARDLARSLAAAADVLDASHQMGH